MDKEFKHGWMLQSNRVGVGSKPFLQWLCNPGSDTVVLAQFWGCSWTSAILMNYAIIENTKSQPMWHKLVVVQYLENTAIELKYSSFKAYFWNHVFMFYARIDKSCL